MRLDEEKEKNINSGEMKKDEPKDQAEAPKKKKLAVVFRSQNSVNHKNHPLGKPAQQKKEQKPTGHVSPNGRPLPPGTARVTPLKQLNEMQRLEEEREAQERARAAAEAKAEAEKAKAAQTEERQRQPRQERSAQGERRPQGDRGAQNRSQGERRSQGDRGFQNKDRNERGQNRSGQTGEKRPQIPNQGGANKQVLLNRGNTERVKGTTDRFAGKESKKFQNKNAAAYENPKSSVSAKNRNNRKDDKYGAAKSYEREDQMVKKAPKKTGKGAFIKPEPKKEAPVEEIKSIQIPESITIKELAEKMKMQPSAIVKKLFMQGQIVTPNSELSYEEAENIALEYDILCEPEEKVDVIAELLKEEEDPEETLVPRPPVVCVMGHVDHGKTSILDAIRKTNVTSHEHGGITQHIGAYQVSINDRVITFLDTPGHEAFTAMRMRGAQSTDIAVLVVAADDGVMPQTVEAINHAKAAGVEVVVAVNKIDKPTANIDKVKQALSEYNLIPEEWGGSTVFAPVSAKTGEGIQNLLEMILLTADVLELKANPNRKARGLVIEAELDKGKGPVARILVQKGTLHVGDTIAAGACYGKVRAMMDDKGRRVKTAGPSTPVEILGLNDVPNAGEVLVGTENEKEAKNFAATFISENKQRLVEESKHKVSLDALFDQIKAGDIKELPIIVKADVQGSVEAVKESLEKITNDEVAVKVIHSGVGAINESDVTLASASNAIVIGFNVKPDATARGIADREKVDVRLYNVIYKAIEDIENAMKGMLAPVYEERIIGHAVIRQIFKASGVGTIAGSYVLDGVIQRGAKARITRGGEQIFEGNIESVKRFKDDVKEVRTGYECGLVFEKFNDLMEDDQIEAYVMEEVKR